jgi:putative transcriptional regulator
MANGVNCCVSTIRRGLSISQLNLMAKRIVFNRMKAVIAEQGKTNIWLAETIGVHPGTVSKWCRNEMQPTVETLFEVADALGVDVRSLLVASK